MSAHSILWQRLDRAGYETARIFFSQPFWYLTGTAVIAHDRQPCLLDYEIKCNQDWHTLSGKVTGWMGHNPVDLELVVDRERHWKYNGTDCPDIDGCIDVDLNFSPSTNLLPIRRLNLHIGQEAQVKAAWLRFPDFTLEPLEQLYRRTDRLAYRYESAGGRFVANLIVNETGFVTHYPNFCDLAAEK
jgi:uncharacterized protein